MLRYFKTFLFPTAVTKFTPNSLEARYKYFVLTNSFVKTAAGDMLYQYKQNFHNRTASCGAMDGARHIIFKYFSIKK